jgi:fumarate hydratase class I
LRQNGFQQLPPMIHLTTPISEEKVRALQVGDAVEISGTVFTGRDALHKYLHDGGPLPAGVHLQGGIIYHCGPVVLKDDQGEWKVVAAGPTTSAREEPYQGQLIREFGLRGIIGKGGMGERTQAACQAHGCVYLHAVGGAAQVLAECISRVRGVHFLKEFGSPEAMWEFEVDRFPVVVTIDAQGHSLHQQVLAASQAALAQRIEFHRLC